jgi:TonB family protein
MTEMRSMFLNFYGLRKQPFGVTPDPEFLYLSATHREALASVAYGVQSGVGFSAIVAKPGMGKTTLLFTLLQHFQNSVQSAFLFDTQCNSKEFLQGLLCEFNIQPEAGGIDASALACLRQFLLRSARARQRVLVVVDEAQNLEIPVFETLRLLSNFETPHAKLLHIVLAGQPELDRKLALAELEQLRQRITIVSRLDVFGPADIIKYVVHRLKLAGYRGGPLFTPEALGVLVEKSHGIPREINRLCFNAMSLGCALEKKIIDAELLREAAADLEFGSLLTREETSPGRPPSETVEALAALFSATMATSTEIKNKVKHIPMEHKFQSASAPVRQPEPASVRQAESAPARQAESAPVRPPEPAPARQSGRFEFPRFDWPAGLKAVPARVSSSARRVISTSQAGVRSAFSRTRKKLNSRPKVSAAAPRSRQPRQFAASRLVWALSLLVIVAASFGAIAWSDNQLPTFDLSRARTLTSQLASDTQTLASGFASDAQNSFGQWFTLAKTAAATADARLQSKLSLSDPSGLESSPASSKPKSISNSATTGKAASGTSSIASLKAAPLARTPDNKQGDTQTPEQPAQLAAPTSGEVLAMQSTVSSAGTATRSNFTASAVPAGHSAMRPIVSETPNPETVLSAKLIKRVDPIYPELARNSDLSGNVVLNAHIDETGKVRAVKAISGDPVLVHAAVDAVRQWEYRPSLVNGQPRPSNARIAINFSLR